VLQTGDEHGLYREVGFEAADETVMQLPKKVFDYWLA
jgi:hypothetical protein